ncbi:MAG TPA: HAMP domain-containing sensor histidine kinase [Cellulomonas sp.]
MSTSLATRITLTCVGVALVAAGLAGFAAARVALAEDRVATATSTTSSAPGGRLDQLRERAEERSATLSPARRIGRAVGVGLVVGLVVGLGAGAGTARVLTRPLRRTAAAARELGSGRRDVRVPVEGPPEVAEVAESLNALAGALETSEARQRTFLLSVSHELRTPLTAVRGFGESIADGVVEGDEARDAARVVVDEADRLTRLVEDLLGLARLGADDFRLELAPTDLAALLDQAVGAWGPRASAAGVRLVVERPGVPLVVHTDAGRVRQVLDGLAANAVRLTPAGAPVVLAVRPTPNGAVLEVRDGGPGLTAEDRAVAFEPGALGARYRDERPVGVGIGLSLVHALVQRLGGGIAVGVSPEGGAAFAVSLPIAAPVPFR